jgi:hypothetical protein
MASKKFNWDKSTWIHDYQAIWTAFLNALIHAHEIYYPDYSLDWFIRTDASQLGVAAVLFQIRHVPASDDVSTEQTSITAEPIAIVSQKFSEQAARWDTIEQEAYAIFFGVKSFDYLLRPKFFIIETDHRNLVWMETSQVAKINRWRIFFLQNFDFYD